MPTLTTANSSFTLIIANLYPQGQTLQGYSTDDMFSTGAVKPAETSMGADGYLSGGWTPTENVMTIMLQGDSASNLVFDAWDAAQEAAREVYVASGVINLPSITAKFALTKGFLTSIQRIGPVRKQLGPRPYEITWGRIIRVPA